MLNRLGSSLVLKRHGSCVELLPHDAVGLILERLPVETLLRFKCVSKKWKSTIESRCFQEQQLIRRKQSRGLDALIVSLGVGDNDNGDYEAPSRRLVLGSSVVSTFKFSSMNTLVCHGSCDGVLCLYCYFTPCVLVNPATQWHQSLPLASLQEFLIDKYDKQEYDFPTPRLGFGKDKVRGTFKAVWLYNSSEFGLDNVTTCEVFDCSTNAWRYLVPASPCRINDGDDPVYLDGSLYWLTLGEESKLVLSMDLHTETFQVICEAPFARVRERFSDGMCVLDNRLCVFEINWPAQVIWSLDSSGGGNKTWKKLCSIYLTLNISWFMRCSFPLEPIAILDQNKLLFQSRVSLENWLVYDLHEESYDLLSETRISGHPVSYYQSLFSA